MEGEVIEIGHSIFARKETFSEAKLALTQFLESEDNLGLDLAIVACDLIRVGK